MCLRPHGQSENFYSDRNPFQVIYTVHMYIYNMIDINIMDDILWQSGTKHKLILYQGSNSVPLDEKNDVTSSHSGDLEKF